NKREEIKSPRPEQPVKQFGRLPEERALARVSKDGSFAVVPVAILRDGRPRGRPPQDEVELFTTGSTSPKPTLDPLRLAADEAQIFPRHRRAGGRRDLGYVVGGCNLDDVHPDKWQLRQTTQDRLRLPARETADFRRSSAGRERRIEHVDVEAEIDGGLT